MIELEEKQRRLKTEREEFEKMQSASEQLKTELAQREAKLDEALASAQAKELAEAKKIEDSAEEKRRANERRATGGLAALFDPNTDWNGVVFAVHNVVGASVWWMRDVVARDFSA